MPSNPTISLLAAIGFALIETGCKARPEEEIASGEFSLSGDQLLASASTPLFACPPNGLTLLYAPQKLVVITEEGEGICLNPYRRLFQTNDIALNEGDVVLLEGQVKSDSGDTGGAEPGNILLQFRMKAERFLVGQYEVVETSQAVNGQNHVSTGSPSDLKYQLIQGNSFFTAPATGTYRFFLEALTAIGKSPIEACNPANICDPGPVYYEAVVTGAQNSYLKVWKINNASVERLDNTGVTELEVEFPGAQPPNPDEEPNGHIEILLWDTVNLFDSGEVFIPPAQATHINVSAYLGLTNDTEEGGDDTAYGNARLAIRNVATGVIQYFPSINGEPFAILRDTHHEKIYLEADITAPQGIETWVEVSSTNGPGLSDNHVEADVGNNSSLGKSSSPQSYLNIWPDNCQMAAHSFEGNGQGSTQGWTRHVCSGYSYLLVENPDYARTGEYYLDTHETTGSSTCNPPAAGGLELNRYKDFTNQGDTFRVTGWTRALSSYNGTSGVTNSCVKILNAGTLAVLASNCRSYTNTTDSGWDYFDYDFTSQVAGVPNVRVVIGMEDSWSADWDQKLFIDDVRVKQCPQ